MSLVLEGVSKKVGATVHIDDVNLTLQRGSLNVLLGATLAGKTSLMRLMAGLDAPTAGRVLVDGPGRDGLAGAAPQRRHGLPAIHQLPDPDRLREHRLAAAGRRRSGAARSRRRVREAAALAAARALSRPQAARSCPAASSSAPPSPARWSRAPISCCSTSRSPISTTSCARSCARSCRASSRRRARSSSTPRRSRPRRCCSAATPRPCSQGRVTQFGPTPQVYRQPARSHHRAGLLRSAAEHSCTVAHQRRHASASSTGGADRGLSAPSRAVPDGRLHRRLPRPPPQSRAARPPTRSRIPAIVSVAEITGSESYRPPRCRRPPLRGARARACSGWSRASAVTALSRPAAPVPLRLGRPARGAPISPAGGVRSDDGAHHPRPSRPRLQARSAQGRQDYALKEIDHVWSQGGAYALLGPSGCGKTTLLNIISGLVAPDARAACCSTTAT